MTLFSLNRVIVKNKESNITLNWMSLNDGRKYNTLCSLDWEGRINVGSAVVLGVD